MHDYDRIMKETLKDAIDTLIDRVFGIPVAETRILSVDLTLTDERRPDYIFHVMGGALNEPRVSLRGFARTPLTIPLATQTPWWLGGARYFLYRSTATPTSCWRKNVFVELCNQQSELSPILTLTLTLTLPLTPTLLRMTIRTMLNNIKHKSRK